MSQLCTSGWKLKKCQYYTQVVKRLKYQYDTQVAKGLKMTILYRSV